MTITIQFLGAAGTVTGSKYLVEGAGKKLLIDCGMFQGAREWRERNWDDPPFDPRDVTATLLTHGHIDHTGLLPRYCARGLTGPVFATRSTCDLLGLLLPDSGRLQEEEAEYRARKGKSRHQPPLPLYTEADANATLPRLKPVGFGTPVDIAPGIRATWHWAGHILGAASIALEIEGKRIVFSGDIGRYGVPVLRDPEAPAPGNLLLIESTYGTREHPKEDTAGMLAEIVTRTVKRGGAVLIPAFAVGRSQLILFLLRELKQTRRIPDIPVIVDSPMARDATAIYEAYPSEYDEQALALLRQGRHPFNLEKLWFVRDRDESKKLNRIQEPMVIISASGMLSGGRVLHHLKHRISSPLNTILFVGYQPPGGRGHWILSGAQSMRILGEDVPVRAETAELSALSAHGDRSELLRWAKEADARRGDAPPPRVAVVHGEPESARAFAATLSRELEWAASPPQYLERWTV